MLTSGSKKRRWWQTNGLTQPGSPKTTFFAWEMVSKMMFPGCKGNKKIKKKGRKHLTGSVTHPLTDVNVYDSTWVIFSHYVQSAGETVATGVQQLLANYQQLQCRKLQENRHSLSHDVTIKQINLFGVTDCDETCLIYFNIMRKWFHLKQ